MRRLAGVLFLLGVVPLLQADVEVIDFEGLSDGTSVTNQYPEIFFSNATVLTAGVSLNELDFPPNSGVNVVFDDGGPISISFSLPVTSFGGYFTYAEPLTLQAFDASNNVLDTSNSQFTDNVANGDGGVAGSSPNEFIEVSSLTDIAEVTITGDPGGGSFVLDDATITTPTTVPEPSSAPFCIATLALIGFVARKRLRRQQNNGFRRS